MSNEAHIGVTSTYSITLPAGATAKAARETSSVDLWKPVGAAGEIIKLMPLNMVKVEAAVDYLGLPAHSQIVVTATTTGAVAPNKTDHLEKINEGGSGTITANSYTAFGDAAGTNAGAGEAASDLGVLNLNSVNVGLGEEARSSSQNKDVIIPAFDGTPGWRGRCTKENTYGVRYKGDIPSGIALGTDGAGFFGFTGGVQVMHRSMVEQKCDDANGGSYDATHAPVAS